MSKWLDWLIGAAVLGLILMAEYQLVFLGVFDPFPLAGGIALLILVRVIHQHAPRFIAAKYKRKP
jgi:preprotein translocase subunit SecY